MPKSYVFIDTNVLLNLYTQQNQVSAEDLHEAITHRESIIRTEQVRAEFLRNHIQHLEKSIKALREYDKTPTVPALLRGFAKDKGFYAAHEKFKDTSSLLKEKLEECIREPSKDETKALVLQLLEPSIEPFMGPDDDAYPALVDRARTRFEAGNPPRKRADTAFGDALNWETCIHYCKHDRRGLILCSDDGDFSLPYGDKRYPNTYLKEEFERELGDEHPLVMTQDLGKALKLLEKANG